MDKTQRDLFGDKARPKFDKLATDLQKRDRQTFKSRLERLRYLDSISPRGISMFGQMEPIFIFEEASLAFLNGAFIATIILCQAAIEHWLTSYLSGKTEAKELPKTLQNMLKQCQKDGIIHDYLIEKIDSLRLIRNPFTHPKSEEYAFVLSRRIFEIKLPPEEILEEDAKSALSLMHTLYLTKGYLRP